MGKDEVKDRISLYLSQKGFPNGENDIDEVFYKIWNIFDVDEENIDFVVKEIVFSSF